MPGCFQPATPLSQQFPNCGWSHQKKTNKAQKCSGNSVPLGNSRGIRAGGDVSFGLGEQSGEQNAVVPTAGFRVRLLCGEGGGERSLRPRVTSASPRWRAVAAVAARTEQDDRTFVTGDVDEGAMTASNPTCYAARAECLAACLTAWPASARALACGSDLGSMDGSQLLARVLPQGGFSCRYCQPSGVKSTAGGKKMRCVMAADVPARGAACVTSLSGHALCCCLLWVLVSLPPAEKAA